jgi:predicted transcriptional regulator
MKFTALFSALLFSGVCFAQQGMPEGMGQMMAKMQQMQRCMAEIDQSKMEQFQKDSERFSNELKKLCEAGKRDMAQKKAMDYAMKINQSAEMKKAQDCMAIMADMPGMPTVTDYESIIRDQDQQHMCDSL